MLIRKLIIQETVMSCNEFLSQKTILGHVISDANMSSKEYFIFQHFY